MSEKKIEELKAKIVHIAKEAEKSGMCKHRSGNFSIYLREASIILISPSGIAREELEPRHICEMDIRGKVLSRAEGVKPSSEALMHLEIYKKRADISAVVHTHARYSTAFAILNKPIPPIVYESSVLGKTGIIPVAAYARAGTEELGENVAKTLEDHDCCLMQSHGAVATAADIETAYLRARYVEEMAELYYITLSIGGGKEPPQLAEEELKKWEYPKGILL